MWKVNIFLDLSYFNIDRYPFFVFCLNEFYVFSLKRNFNPIQIFLSTYAFFNLGK